MWQLTPGQSLRLFQFDDEAVLYNDLTGATHLLGGAAIAVLARLQAGAASAADLTAEFPDEPSGALDEQLDDLLCELAALFLIERAC